MFSGCMEWNGSVQITYMYIEGERKSHRPRAFVRETASTDRAA